MPPAHAPSEMRAKAIPETGVPSGYGGESVLERVADCGEPCASGRNASPNEAKRPTGDSRRPAKTEICGPAAIRYFMPSHLLFSTGLSAPNPFGRPQYRAPVAHTMR